MKFQRLGFLTLIFVYLLVLAGGIVRSTGSGMGCPDWPTCFGRLIPPTQESQLPFNYQEIYKEKLHGEIVFNPTKTWIEYLNRLLGALTGFIILICTIASYKVSKKTFLFTFIAFLFVIGNGVLGKYVVDSFLLPGVVTAHMALTIGVIFFLLKALYHSQQKIVVGSFGRNLILLNLVLIALQILLGTQVREEMDVVIKEFGETTKAIWIDQLGIKYVVHRSFTWVIILTNGYLYFKLNKNQLVLRNYLYNIFVLLGISVLSGILMAYFALPIGSQPVHLTLSLLTLGLHLRMWILSTNDE
jgi:cytochrome c oxidase assembly protein subunit 15